VKSWLSFRGRATRREYWVRTLLAMLVFFLSGIVLLLAAGIAVPWLDAHLGLARRMTALSVLAVFALLLLDMVFYVWVLLAVSVRRLHDLGYSGKAGFCSLRVSLQAGYARGTAGPNAYGPDPLG
jgi:uncharacterized membrane protein YhaH (DUF805 family)